MLPSAVYILAAYSAPATPKPPPTRTAPVVVLVAELVFAKVTTAFELKSMLVPLSAEMLSNAMLPTLVIFWSLKLVAPKVHEPVPLNELAPISMLPNPVDILPELSCPVPVISAWCCVTPLDWIRASGIVPLVNCVATKSVSPLPFPENVLVPILILPNPDVMLPAFKAPVPVISNWCCVIALEGTLASGIVPLVRSLALASPIKLSAFTSFATCNPPVIFTEALPVAKSPVAFVASVKVTKLFAVSVVNAAELGVKFPIGILFIASAISTPPAEIVKSPSVVRLFLTVVVPDVAPIWIAVAACPNAIVVTLSLSRLNVPVSSVSSVVPLIAKSFVITIFVFFNVIVPVVAPMFKVEAASAKLTVVGVVLAIFTLASLNVKSPPSISISPSTFKLFCIVVVPLAAPIVKAVAALAKFTVVAVVSINPNVVLPVVILVVIAGLVPNTATPVPVSSLNTPANSAEVVAANWSKPSSTLAIVPLVGNVTLVFPVVVIPNV